MATLPRRKIFQQAWDSRTDDYEASVAAHFLARHQPTPAATLYWNRVAVEHANAVADDRAKPLLASLYLNLADSLLAVGALAEAGVAAERGIAGLEFLPPDGYREFVARALHALCSRLAKPMCPTRVPRDSNPR